jgi:serine protease Do
LILGLVSPAMLHSAEVGPAVAAADPDGATPKNLDELRAIEAKFKEASAEAVKCVVGIQIGTARGSGVIVSEDGLILTAGHVAQKPGNKATITTSDGKTYKGESLGICFSADAGMMKITDKGKWPHLELAAKGETHVGDWCLAVGHPLGYLEGRPPVIRMGRVIRLEERATQTDCPLIVGDSGGPLVSLEGKVIGINSRISAPLSMNYHVPIEVFHQYWDRLKKGEAWADSTLRDAAQVKAAFRKVVAETAKCVVQVRCDQKDAVLGTIVGPDGWVLTKASELKGRVVVRLADGRDLEARTIGVNPQFDLAMLKIDAVDLPKIGWEFKDPEVGQWVAVPGLGEDPLAVGVVSVPRRTIPAPKGLLGVTVEEKEKGLTIAGVIPTSPAAKAGLQKGDIVTHLGGRPVKTLAEFTGPLKLLRPGTSVKLTIRRGEETLEKSITLGMLVTLATRKRDSLNATGVGISRRHDDFPMVLQHDGAVRPVDCGSPLVTLDGKAVGVNVARGGRTETYCIPSNALVVLMYDLMSGRLRPASVDEKKPDAETKPATKEEPKADAKPAPKEGPKEGPKPEAKPAPKEEPKPEAKPAPKEEPKPVTKPAPKEEPKPVTKPAPKEEPKPEAKPAPKEEAKPEAKPAPKEEPKPEAKPAPKEEAKPEAKPAPKEVPKDQPKPDEKPAEEKKTGDRSIAEWDVR